MEANSFLKQPKENVWFTRTVVLTVKTPLKHRTIMWVWQHIRTQPWYHYTVYIHTFKSQIPVILNTVNNPINLAREFVQEIKCHPSQWRVLTGMQVSSFSMKSFYGNASVILLNEEFLRECKCHPSQWRVCTGMQVSSSSMKSLYGNASVLLLNEEFVRECKYHPSQWRVCTGMQVSSFSMKSFYANASVILSNEEFVRECKCHPMKSFYHVSWMLKHFPHGVLKVETLKGLCQFMFIVYLLMDSRGWLGVT